MQNHVWKKGLVLGIIILFFGAGVFPSVSGNIIVEKNNQNVVNTQKLENSDTSNWPAFWRTYLFGTISNFHMYGDDDYYFDCINVHVFHIESDSDGNFVFSHEHAIEDPNWGFLNFGFRGILKPTFICGYFYITFP